MCPCPVTLTSKSRERESKLKVKKDWALFALTNIVFILQKKSVNRETVLVQTIFSPAKFFSTVTIVQGSCVGAARKVSPDWSQKTMTCHSFNCFSIVWGQG